MKISDVRVRLINDGNDRLKAVCTVTFDDEFVVRDIKVVEGANGLFVAMPSRKVSVHCQECGFKNAIRSRFCNECGAKLPPSDVVEDDNGRSRLHRDIAHPITTPFREHLQREVLRAYEAEQAAPGGRRTRRDEQPTASEFEEQHEESPHEEPEERGELSEYDAIIAGLRSGIRRDGSRREGSRRRPESEGAFRSRSGERAQSRTERRGAERAGKVQQNRDAGRSRRKDGGAGRGNQRSRSVEAKPAAEPVPAAAYEETPVVQPEPASASVEGFGAGLVEDEGRHAAPPRTQAPPAPPSTEQPATDEDEDTFGAGIL